MNRCLFNVRCPKTPSENRCSCDVEFLPPMETVVRCLDCRACFVDAVEWRKHADREHGSR